jgi:PAS domain S-box-containing protein
MIAVLLIGSILAQICAVVVSCKLMRITRRRLVWVLFCAAVFLMVIRRCLSLFELTFGSPPGIPSLEVEVVAFLVSVLMAVGLSLLIPIFKSWQESEDASREGELRFRQLCEAAFEGVVIHAEGLVLDANPRFAALFGYAPSEVVGKAVIDFVSHDTKGLVLSHFRDSADEPFEYEAVRKDGSVFAVEACSRPTSCGAGDGGPRHHRAPAGGDRAAREPANIVDVDEQSSGDGVSVPE